MSNYARYRDLHLWVGLLLLAPTTVIAVTGLLWNHERTLGLKPRPPAEHAAISTTGSSLSQGEASPAEGLVSPLTVAAGEWRTHAAAIDAALAAGRDAWGADAPLERIELRQEPGMGLVVKVKVPEERGWEPHELVWSVAAGRIVERKGDPAEGTDWAKLVHDLHTGKFFSRQFGFLWSDAGAAAILFLGATGVILYVWPLLKKRSKRQRSQMGPQTGGETSTPLALIRSGEVASR